MTRTLAGCSMSGDLHPSWRRRTATSVPKMELVCSTGHSAWTEKLCALRTPEVTHKLDTPVPAAKPHAVTSLALWAVTAKDLMAKNKGIVAVYFPLGDLCGVPGGGDKQAQCSAAWGQRASAHWVSPARGSASNHLTLHLCHGGLLHRLPPSTVSGARNTLFRKKYEIKQPLCSIILKLLFLYFQSTYYLKKYAALRFFFFFKHLWYLGWTPGPWVSQASALHQATSSAMLSF